MAQQLVLLVWPGGEEEFISRTEAQDLIFNRDAEYGGAKDGHDCVVMKYAREWRKTTKRNCFGFKTGVAGMELVRQ